jgi:hypothetical protein
LFVFQVVVEVNFEHVPPGPFAVAYFWRVSVMADSRPENDIRLCLAHNNDICLYLAINQLAWHAIES